MQLLFEEFLSEAIRIGEDLLTRKIDIGAGSTWESMFLDPERNISWVRSESLYSGVSGIALFFTELYSITKQAKYLEAAERGMDWVAEYHKKYPTTNYAFLTGRGGIAYVYLRLYRITGRKEYLEKAVAIGRECVRFIEPGNTPCEYINGAAGTLHLLLHLHSASSDREILSLIKRYTEYILSKAVHGQKGLYWDRSRNQIRGLCGFSHGAAGVGYVFLELGYYFSNPAYFYIADMAFAYENHYFDKDKNNWPDFRVDLHSKKSFYKAVDDFEKNGARYLSDVKDMNAWCHGAAGIGLARVRSLELTNRRTYKTDIEKAVERTRSSEGNHSSHSLCHGLFGNLEVLVKSGWKENIAHAQKNAAAVIKSHHSGKPYISGYGGYTDGEDTSLFMGSAGVGYTLLRLHSPETVPSILAPDLAVRCSAEHKMGVAVEEIKKRFRLTGELIWQLKVEKNVESNALLFVRRYAYREVLRRLEEHPSPAIDDIPLRLDPYTRLRKVNKEYFIHRLSDIGWQKIKVNEFCYSVIAMFGRKCSIKEAVGKWERIYGRALDRNVRGKAAGAVENQIRNGISAGIICLDVLEYKKHL